MVGRPSRPLEYQDAKYQAHLEYHEAVWITEHILGIPESMFWIARLERQGEEPRDARVQEVPVPRLHGPHVRTGRRPAG